MTFPAGLTTITVTGQNVLGPGGSPLSGDIIFTPSGVITAVPAVALVLEGSAVAQVSAGVLTQPFALATTDCVSPGFTYTISFRLQTPDGMPVGLAPIPDVAIPASLGASVDISALVPGAPPPASTAFNSDNTWTGVQTFGGAPPLIIPAGAAAGDVLTSDASGHASWQPPTGGGGGGGISPPAGDLGGTALSPTVTGTHLASPLPVAQGGTGQATQQAALDALAGGLTSGQVLRGNGTHVQLSALQAGDIPALAYDASGAAAAAQSTAEGYTDGKVATEASRAEAAEALAAQKSANLSDLASAATARTNLGLGTAATQASSAFDAAGAAAAAQAASVPIGDLPLSLVNGGTGQATQQAAIDALAAAVTSGLYLRGNGSHVVLGAIQAADVPALAYDASGAAATAQANAQAYADTNKLAKSSNLSDVGTRQTALNNLAGAATSGQVLRGNGTNVALAAIQSGDVPGFDGVTVTGTPASGQVPVATSSSAATWQTLSLPVVTFTYGSTGAVPASGTWTTGTAVVDQNSIIRVCTAGGTPGTWARDGALPWEFWVDDYGAKGDGHLVGDGAMTTGTATLTSASAPFTSTAVDGGKNIIVNGALGASNAPLYAKILTITNSTTAVLDTNATNTVTNAAAFWASDDCAAIVSAINAAKAYALANLFKALLRFRSAAYGLATLTTTAASGALAQQNALVPIPYPAVNGTTRKLMFELVGVGEQADEQYFQSTIPSITGTALVATVAASGTSPSVVGGPNASTNLTGTWANTKVIVKGVTVWCGFNPGWTAWDLSQCSACWVDNAGAQVLAPAGGGQNPGVGALPTNSAGWGFVFPSNNDAGAGRLMVEGYYQGVGVSPRTTIEKLFTQANVRAVFARSVNATVVHGARIGYWSCQICTNAIWSNGTSGTMPLVIDLMDCTGAITTDLSDANGVLVGSINWTADTRSSPTVVAGQAIKITNLRLNPGPMSSPPSTPSSGSPSTAVFRDTEVTLSLSGGTLTALLIDGVDQHIPASCVLWKFALPSGHTYTPTYTGTLSTDVAVM